jgi:hypothetical protein
VTEDQRRSNAPMNGRYQRKFGGSKYDAQPAWDDCLFTVATRATVADLHLFLDGLELAAETEAFLSGELK